MKYKMSSLALGLLSTLSTIVSATTIESADQIPTKNSSSVEICRVEDVCRYNLSRNSGRIIAITEIKRGARYLCHFSVENIPRTVDFRGPSNRTPGIRVDYTSPNLPTIMNVDATQMSSESGFWEAKFHNSNGISSSQIVISCNKKP